MKIFVSILGIILAAIILGLSLPSIVPGCHCELQGGCQGCGGILGNALGGFSITCFALGAIGFVLLVWFGIPLALLLIIGFGLYKLFSKEKKKT